MLVLLAQVNGGGALACRLGWHRVRVYYSHGGRFSIGGGDPAALSGGSDVCEVHCAHTVTDLISYAQDEVAIVTIFKLPMPCFLFVVEFWRRLISCIHAYIHAYMQIVQYIGINTILPWEWYNENMKTKLKIDRDYELSNRIIPEVSTMESWYRRKTALTLHGVEALK